jgi:aryl-alcohol dehydrogenase-like predicted oxidoreductase
MTLLNGTELDVSAVCLGGNVFGWTIDEARSFEVLDAFLEAGGNFIDTADMYGRRGDAGEGSSERIIGRWIASRGNREDVVIATKVGMGAALPGLSAANIAAAVDASLKRLGVERIDLYYAHADDPKVSLEETLGAFDELIKAGKIAHVAASNYSATRLREALSISAATALAPFVALQPHYNLLERSEYEGALAELCAEQGIACIPYFGLARGFLTGKYRPDGDAVSSPRASGVLESYGNPRGFGALSELEHIASAHGVAPAAVALVWLLSKPTVLAPIASATSVEQLAQSMQAMSLTLTPGELARLDAAGA